METEARMDISDRQRTLRADVAADLGEIFRLPQVEAARQPAHVQTYVGETEAAASSRRSRYGGLAAAALAGLAVGAVLMGTSREPAPVQAPVTAPVEAVIAPSAAPPAPRVIVTAAATAPAPDRTEAPPRAAAKAPKVQKAVQTGPAPKAKRVKRPELRRVSAEGCGRLRGDALARCAYPDVLAADRRLRRAYEDAADAGVGSDELADYRSRWASLRRRANRDPGLVIESYSLMAGDLRQLAHDAEAARS
ncbi:hypothetical protein [Phenylobacterium sp.]|jgi:hypothetical protein|uniref:hypothetical protein n=1 Tax=Phenylobacterium sp. TaxID=1871053 RepID=UPI0037836134